MEDCILITPLCEAKRFMIDCFDAVGICNEYSQIIAENLLEADYRGHTSHGMNRLEWYINDVKNKVVNPNAVPVKEKETVATALVNGMNGLGAVVGKYSMNIAISKAKEAGIGMVAAYNSNHYGIAGIYALQAMKEGLIGISVTNTSPCVVPTRGKEAALGTNPIAFGMPSTNCENFLLDMATSTVAMGKIELQSRKKQPVPNGWALNEEGFPECDADKALKAKRLLPLGGEELSGGYKGYGLSLMVEILSGILSGSNYGPNIPCWSQNGRNEIANLGHTFIAINPSAFAPGFEGRLSDLTSVLRRMEPQDPEKPVLIPGDPEIHHMKCVDAQGGICYVQNQHESNNILAEQLNVLPLKSEFKMKSEVKP